MPLTDAHIVPRHRVIFSRLRDRAGGYFLIEERLKFRGDSGFRDRRVGGGRRGGVGIHRGGEEVVIRHDEFAAGEREALFILSFDRLERLRSNQQIVVVRERAGIDDDRSAFVHQAIGGDLKEQSDRSDC